VVLSLAKLVLSAFAEGFSESHFTYSKSKAEYERLEKLSGKAFMDSTENWLGKLSTKTR